MDSHRLADKNFTKWSSTEVAAYIQSKEGIGNYAELFQKHKIDGSIAHRMTDNDLKEMGVAAIGDRHRILGALESLQKAKAQQDREKIIWEGDEVVFWSCWDKCWKTGCGFCPYDLAHFRLRSAHLEITRPDYNRIGKCMLCWGHSETVENIDLSNVSNVTLEKVPPPCFYQCCCCASPRQDVHVGLSEPQGVHTLQMKKGLGDEISRKIKNQVEVMQRMERS